MKLNESAPTNPLARWVLLAGLERHLIRTGAPRLQMLILVLATGAVGLLTSVGLLHLHVEVMVLRYVISVIVAYGAFLALVWLWIIYQRRRWNRIGRVGASGAEAPREPQPTESYSLLELLELLLDADDLAGMVLIAAGVVSIFFAIWYLISVIAFAPEFLAEVSLDGVFSAALYRRLRRIEHRHWLKSAFARTKAPFLWTLLFFAFLGIVSHFYAPEAVSIGGVIRHMFSPMRL